VPMLSEWRVKGVALRRLRSQRACATALGRFNSLAHHSNADAHKRPDPDTCPCTSVRYANADADPEPDPTRCPHSVFHRHG
jgi:hypothetical protein